MRSELLVALSFLCVFSPHLFAESAKPKKTSYEVVSLGTYSNMAFTPEHQYGYEAELWKYNGKIIGHFSHSEGLAGDTPIGLIQSVNYNESSGVISFAAKLSLGSHFCKKHENIPSRQMYKFKGKLEAGALNGKITEHDGLHGFKVTRSEDIELTRDTSEIPSHSFKTYKEWKKNSDEIMNSRGSKW